MNRLRIALAITAVILIAEAVGGYLANSLALLADEPFVRAGKMRFTRVTEFNPAQFQTSLQTWFAA